VEQFKNSSGNDVGEVGERVRMTMAKRRAEYSVRTLSSLEQEALINELFASENPNYTPDGKNTFVMLGQEELLNLFN
jgi:DNA mismatch repair protein MutL